MNGIERMNQIFQITLITILWIIASPKFQVLSAEKEEKWQNGQVKKSYAVDDENKINGHYEEYYESGKLKIKANYKNNLLEGNYFEYFEDGKLKLESQYIKGQKNGYLKTYDKGVLIKSSLWQNNLLIYTFPKTPDQINRELNNISKLKTEFVGEWPKDFKGERFTKTVEEDNIAALTKLREYRYLCGIPYEDLQINKEYIARNLDAVIVLKKLGGLNHFPQNPGVPEDVFKSGYIGTSSSNLAFMGFKINSAQTIPMYMNDSDALNIAKVGHRRWCLSPNMKMTGFAVEDGFGAMWSINVDKMKKQPPEFDVICYPARGYMPISHFQNSCAWSVSINPNIYKTKSLDTIKIKFYSFKDGVKEELKLTYQTINSEYIGTTNCLIFTPEKISLTPGSCYQVLITGIKDKNGKDTKIEYFVEFF